MNKIKCLVIFLILSLTFMGCSKKEESQEKSSSKIKVYASFYPVYDFAQKIGKDKIDLKLIIPNGVEPHDWEPSAKLIGEIQDANVIIYNGLGMEPWIEKTKNTLDNKNTIWVDTSKNADLILLSDNEDKDNHKDLKYDPHIWLNPLNALSQAEAIKNSLIKADPKNKNFYQNNFTDFKKNIFKLDEQFKSSTSKLKNKNLVVSHKAFTYLASRYDLNQVSISGISPDEEPTSSNLAKLSKFVKKNDVKYIYFETLANPKLAQVLANEANINTKVLNPLEGLTPEDIKSKKDYFSTMRENLKSIEDGLK